MPKKTNQLVKESNALARARIIPVCSTVWGERIIAAFAAKNRTEDWAFKEHLIDLEELFPLETEKISNSQYSELKKAVEHLTRSYFQIRKSNGDFMNYPIFTKIGLEGNCLVGKFNQELAEHYLELKKQFSIRSLPEFQVLSGTYSQQVFRYLNSWKDTIEITVSLSELHETFAVPLSFRKDFKAFRIRVLELAHREITEKTTLKYEWEPIKRGLRKVVAVRFIFDLEKAAEAEAKRLEAQRKNGEMKTFVELQRMSNQCYERLSRLKRICTPKKSEKCDFCTTRGRMYAQKLIEENQTKIPFLNRVAQPS